MASRKMYLWRFVFLRCFLISFVGISASYYLLKAVFGQSPVSPPFRAIMYWDAHPLQYIGVICFCYAFSSALWAAFFGQSKSWSRVLQISAVLIASILVSSFAWGVLWSFHDMQAGWFPVRVIEKMGSDGQMGLFWGPRIICYSFPLNLIALALGYIVTHQVTAQRLERVNLVVA